VEIFKLFFVFRVNFDSDPNPNPNLFRFGYGSERSRIRIRIGIGLKNRIRIRKKSFGSPTLHLTMNYFKKYTQFFFWDLKYTQFLKSAKSLSCSPICVFLLTKIEKLFHHIQFTEGSRSEINHLGSATLASTPLYPQSFFSLYGRYNPCLSELEGGRA